MTAGKRAFKFTIGAGRSIEAGAGAPSHAAAQGSLYLRSNGAAASTIYVNTDGSTTWVAMAAAGAAGALTITDTPTYYTTDTVDGALDAIGVQIGGDSDVTYAFTAQQFVADNDAVYAAINKLDIGFATTVGYATADPGDGNAIPVTKSALVPITIGAGVEANTCAIPTFSGQKLTFVIDVDGGGSRAVTFASGINVTGNTIATFDTARQILIVEAIQIGGVLAWEVTSNIGTVALT